MKASLNFFSLLLAGHLGYAASVASDNSAAAITDTFELLKKNFEEVTDLADVGFNLDRQNAMAVLQLIQLGNKLYNVNKAIPSPVEPGSSKDQETVCKDFNGKLYYITQSKFFNDLGSGIVQGAKAQYTGYYATLVQKLSPELEEFEDWVIEFAPMCEEESSATKEKLQKFRKGALKNLKDSPLYAAAFEGQVPDFDGSEQPTM